MRHAVVVLAVAASSLVSPVVAAAQEDAFSLDGLVVTTSPVPRSAGSVASHVTILEGAELRELGITSVADALRDVAGVNVARSGSFGQLTSLFLRGGESDQTLVLVDGVQVNQAGGSFDFAGLTTDDVERIEIVRGPASALYGSDAMAGVIHVVTRTGRGSPQVGARVVTAYYSEPRDQLVDGLRWSTDVTGGSDRFGYSATLSRETQEGILAFNNRFLNTVGSGTARFVPDDRTRVDLSLRVASRQSHYPTNGSGEVVDQNAFGFADETLARVGAARRLARAVEIEASLTVNEIDGGTDDAPDDASDTDGFKSLDHFRRTAVDVRGNVEAGGAVVTLGGEIEEERQRSFSEAASAFGVFYGRAESERLNLATFAHVAGELGFASYNGGVRLEDNERFGSVATWQVGLAAHVPDRPETRIRASMGTGIKEPTFYENFAADGFSVGNPDLDPERSRSWELGLEHAVVDGVTLQATFFDQRLEDLIQYVYPAPSPTEPNFYNVAEASARGLEVGAEARVHAVETGVSYAWLDTEVRDAGVDEGAGAYFVEGESLLRRPAHTLAVHAATPLTARGRVHTRVSFVGARADRSFDPVTFAPAREELPRYVLWTLGADWSVLTAGPGRPGVSLSVRAENLLDEAYEEVWGFRAPGRQVYLGVSIVMGGG